MYTNGNLQFIQAIKRRKDLSIPYNSLKNFNTLNLVQWNTTVRLRCWIKQCIVRSYNCNKRGFYQYQNEKMKE
jgi:hypothetical protein